MIPLSNIEEDRFLVALQIDVEVYRITITLPDQCGDAYFVFDTCKNRIFCVCDFFVGKIHAGIETDIDPSRHNPEVDVRRHQPTVTKWHTSWLNRLKYKF